MSNFLSKFPICFFAFAMFLSIGCSSDDKLCMDTDSDQLGIKCYSNDENTDVNSDETSYSNLSNI